MQYARSAHAVRTQCKHLAWQQPLLASTVVQAIAWAAVVQEPKRATVTPADHWQEVLQVGIEGCQPQLLHVAIMTKMANWLH